VLLLRSARPTCFGLLAALGALRALGRCIVRPGRRASGAAALRPAGLLCPGRGIGRVGLLRTARPLLCSGLRSGRGAGVTGLLTSGRPLRSAGMAARLARLVSAPLARSLRRSGSTELSVDVGELDGSGLLLRPRLTAAGLVPRPCGRARLSGSARRSGPTGAVGLLWAGGEADCGAFRVGCGAGGLGACGGALLRGGCGAGVPRFAGLVDGRCTALLRAGGRPGGACALRGIGPLALAMGRPPALPRIGSRRRSLMRRRGLRRRPGRGAARVVRGSRACQRFGAAVDNGGLLVWGAFARCAARSVLQTP